jgi:hypothetical protein
LRNNNRLMSMYPSLLGGKTGFDYDAGWCLIEVARRNGHTMISVTLDGIHPDDWYDDNEVLLEYAFEQKEARLAAGAPITGQIVSFRDPDAAIIAQIASAGGSIGQPMVAGGPAEPGGPDQAGATSGLAPESALVTEPVEPAFTLVRGASGPNLQILAAFLVAAIVLAGRALFTFSQPAARRVGATVSPARARRLAMPRFEPRPRKPASTSEPTV